MLECRPCSLWQKWNSFIVFWSTVCTFSFPLHCYLPPQHNFVQCSSPAMFGSDQLLGDGVDGSSSSGGGLSNGFPASTPGTPPLLSPRNHRTPPPPPIPPKSTSTPLTPLSPPSSFTLNTSGDDLTPTTPTNIYIGDIENTHPSLHENYSVPPRLQPYPPPSSWIFLCFSLEVLVFAFWCVGMVSIWNYSHNSVLFSTV